MNLSIYSPVVLIWGTTWIAQKLQLGVVQIALSIGYRFALAAAVMFTSVLWNSATVPAPYSAFA
jgi:hypothetical protein